MRNDSQVIAHFLFYFFAPIQKLYITRHYCLNYNFFSLFSSFRSLSGVQIWFKGVRASKFRHVFGSSRKECYTDISIHRNGKDGNLVCVNPNFLAIEADAAFIVIPLTTTGRIDFQRCKVIGHTSQIFDLKWNPFNDYEIASASDDCTVSCVLLLNALCDSIWVQY